ncbi:MAG: hypothetical protein ACRDSJ_17820, partial [Rubrobacteraceae bacterium]
KDCAYNARARKITCDLGNMADEAVKRTRIVVKATKPGRLTLRGCAVRSGTPDLRSTDNRLAEPAVTTAEPPSSPL